MKYFKLEFGYTNGKRTCTVVGDVTNLNSDELNNLTCQLQNAVLTMRAIEKSAALRP